MASVTSLSISSEKRFAEPCGEVFDYFDHGVRRDEVAINVREQRKASTVGVCPEDSLQKSLLLEGRVIRTRGTRA